VSVQNAININLMHCKWVLVTKVITGYRTHLEYAIKGQREKKESRRKWLLLWS